MDAVTHWLQQAGRHPLLTAAEEVHLGTLIRAWQDHPGGPGAAPAAVQRRGRRALDRMVAGNLRLVATVVRNMRTGLGGAILDADVPDLLQAGAMGLIRGAERFDPARGYKFSTYGYWWIRQGVSRWADGSCRTIRLPVNHPFHAAKLGRLGTQLTQELGRTPTISEMAEALGMSPTDFGRLIQVASPCLSLDAPARATEESCSLGELQAAPQLAEDPRLQDLRASLEALPVHEARMARRYWGLEGKAWTQLQLAAAEGISRDQVQRALARIRAKLRGQLSLPI